MLGWFAISITDAEGILGNDQALDFASAFVDVEHFGIAEITLDWILI